MLAHQVSVKNCYGPSTHFQELGQKHVGYGGLSGTRQARKENRHALLMPRRIAAPQLLHDFGIRKPRWNIAAFIEAMAKFGSRDIQNPRFLRHLIIGNILVLILE